MYDASYIVNNMQKEFVLTEEITSQTEEFLESIYRLQERDGVAKTGELVEMLRVVPGTVTNTIERLEKRRLVTHETYRGVKLTEEGMNIALRILRSHRLSERLLTDILHMKWNQVHEAACRLEHGITDDVAGNIEKVLKSPQTCPHGNPIPTDQGSIIAEQSGLLSKLDPGEEGLVTSIIDENPSTLKYIEKLGLKPGARVKVLKNAFPEGPLTVRINRFECEISPKTSSILRVKKLGGGSEVSSEADECRDKTEEPKCR